MPGSRERFIASWIVRLSMHFSIFAKALLSRARAACPLSTPSKDLYDVTVWGFFKTYSKYLRSFLRAISDSNRLVFFFGVRIQLVDPN